MTRPEAAQVLKEIAYEIYDKLDEMEAILEEVAPEEFELARVYWMAHIDRSLFNRKKWKKARFITLEDTLTLLLYVDRGMVAE